MTITWSGVYSSHVAEIGYDDETQEMLVKWDSGRISGYKGVSAEEAELISKSPSVGQALRQVKGRYPHRYRDG
jgi:hypothetical protein